MKHLAPPVAVTGLALAAQRPNRGGSTILAHFDAEIGGLTVYGFALVQSARSGLAVWPPRGGGPESNRRMVLIHDPNLRADLLRVALLAFEALGGRYPEPVAEDRPPALLQKRETATTGADGRRQPGGSKAAHALSVRPSGFVAGSGRMIAEMNMANAPAEALAHIEQGRAADEW
jgi:hypothetical protein